MGIRIGIRCLAFTTLSFMALSTFYLIYSTQRLQNCDCDEDRRNFKKSQRSESTAVLQDEDEPSWGPHKLCIIIPYRGRFEELLEFVPHMHSFLSNQKVRHKILAVNQWDELRFNRAALINVGFLQSIDKSSGCDYIAMHDVDLMPINPDLPYPYPENGPFHVAAPELHPKYHYDTFVGGILLFSVGDFKKIRGMSNRFWGWGREDDELYSRLIDAKLEIHRPKGVKSDKTNTFKHFHNKRQRPRDYKRYGNQNQDSRKRDRTSGYDNVKYEIQDTYDVKIKGAPATIYNVELKCDFDDTPWCAHSGDLERLKQKAAGTWVEEKEREVYKLGGGPNH